jgi:hypothetical protein
MTDQLSPAVPEGAPRDWQEKLRAILQRYPDAIFVVPTLFDELQELAGAPRDPQEPPK